VPGPLVLLHGIPVTSSIWRHVARPLARYGRVIAPDLPGLASPQPEVPRGPDDCFRWLDAEVLAGVEEPVTLVVHDVGGPVGLHWAVRRPERVARLVIMNTGVHPDATPWGLLLKVPGLVPAIFALTMARPLFRWQMRALFRLADEVLIREYEAVYTLRESRRAVARMVAAWSHALADVAAGLRRLRHPALLLWGLRDRYIFPWRPYGERLWRDLPHARVVHLPDAGHFLQVERPDEVVRHIGAFVSARD
jgi:haloalkane dehalogenase